MSCLAVSCCDCDCEGGAEDVRVGEPPVCVDLPLMAVRIVLSESSESEEMPL